MPASNAHVGLNIGLEVTDEVSSCSSGFADGATAGATWAIGSLPANNRVNNSLGCSSRGAVGCSSDGVRRIVSQLSLTGAGVVW